MSKIKGLSEKDKEINTKIYQEYEKLHMEDGWGEAHKLRNFKQMLYILELTNEQLDGKSCLDVGCGSGDLSVLLRKLGAKEYLGIDMYEPAIQSARQKYPRETFILDDFLKIKLSKIFDYVFCSGSLTVKLATDNYEFLEATVAKMWKATRIGLVFNILTDEDRSPDKDLFFYNVDKVLNICRKIAPQAKIETFRHPTEAEIHVYIMR